jgi:DNA-binding NarL/FixJ family response regulator
VRINDCDFRASQSTKSRLNVSVSIVEDDDSVRRILVDWISQTPGFRCSGNHRTAEYALKGVPDENPNVVLMDINLPGQSGIDCVYRLKSLLPRTQFLMLTVYEDAEHIFHALAAGAAGYLLKRTPREELLLAIHQVHEGGSPMTSYIARKVVQSFQRPRAEQPQGDGLSPREWEVLDHLARGYAYKEISEALGISIPTVNTHIHRIYEKLHVRSRGQAVAKYAQFPPRTPLIRSAGKA